MLKDDKGKTVIRTGERATTWAHSGTNWYYETGTPYFVIERDALGELINEVNRVIAQHQFLPLGVGRSRKSEFWDVSLRRDRSGIRPDLVDKTECKGDLKGFWSVTVRANWRIIFRFKGEDAHDVESIDDH